MNIKEIYNYILEHKGITYSVFNGKIMNFNNGYIVSIKGSEKSIKIRNFCQKDIEGYVEKHRVKLSTTVFYLGAWINMNNDIVYLDISVYLEGFESAIALGQINNQETIWDCANNVVIQIQPGYLTQDEV